jgi:hypothetical protein
MPLPVGPKPVEWVSNEIIRREFNERQLFEKVGRGELIVQIRRRSHPKRPPRGEPKCTWSQIAYYFTPTNELVAIVHQYRRPDGKLGASGKPDPKRLILEDRILSVRTDDDRED